MSLEDYMLLNCVFQGIVKVIELAWFLCVQIPWEIIKGIYKCATKNSETTKDNARYSNGNARLSEDRTVQPEKETNQLSKVMNEARRNSEIRNAGLPLQNNHRKTVMQMGTL